MKKFSVLSKIATCDEHLLENIDNYIENYNYTDQVRRTKYCLDEYAQDKKADSILDAQETSLRSVKNLNMNIIWRSRYGYFNLTNKNSQYKINGTYDQNICVSDWLMFNKFNINIDDVDRILSLCKFLQHNNKCIQVDAWIFTQNKYDYDIKYDYSNIVSMNFVDNDIDKLQVAQTLIKIMNNCMDDKINKNNYDILGMWHEKNKKIINLYKTEKFLLYEQHKKNKDKHVDSCVININNKLTHNEILEILYTFAKNGSIDQSDFSSNTYALDQITDDKFVDKIQEANIKTFIGTDQINLLDYLEYNGDIRTYDAISQIMNNIKLKN